LCFIENGDLRTSGRTSQNNVDDLKSSGKNLDCYVETFFSVVKKNNLFALEKRIIDPFRRQELELFFTKSNTLRGPTPFLPFLKFVVSDWFADGLNLPPT
jgi:hypothetical protein